MKKALRLILMFFIIYICSTLIGTLFYSFYLSVLNFVAGQKLDLFGIDTMMKSLFSVAIIMCFLIFPFLSYYRIRHVGGTLQTVAYVLLVIVTFAALLPGVLHCRKVFYENYPTTNNFTHLSGGYFREANGKIYYFTKDFFSNPLTGDDTPTIIIDTAENGVVSIESIKESPDFPLYKEAEPFKEVMLKNTFGNEMLSKFSGLEVLVEDSVFSFSRGLSYYCGFLAIGLAFASIYAMTRFFKWKLLNSFLIIVNSFIVVAASNYYYTPAADGIKNTLENNGVINFLGRFIDEPILSCFYVIFSLVLIIVGSVTLIISKGRKKKKA